MKTDIQIEGLGLVTYEESAWSGKKKISIDGREATKIDKKTFRLDDKTISISGNFLNGLRLVCDNVEYTVIDKPKWYEYVLCVISLVFALTWGNSAYLCNIFPVVGGAIGGAISGASMVLQLYVLKSIKKPLYKILISIAMTVATIGVLFLIALAILNM